MTENSITVDHLTKIFKLFDKPTDRLKEALLPFGKAYHRDFYALNDISFEIKKGETVGIIGKNGAGKSTLLKILTGVITPTTGQYRINGKVSSLLELGTGFNPEMTGLENIYLYGSLIGYARQQMEARVESIIQFADIGKFVNQPVKTYSSGMYVRLAFSVAIEVEPEVLIVDEALSVGDTAFQAKCFIKFQEFMERGITILFVTHAMDIITRYCNSALLLEQGQLVKTGSAKEVVDEYNRMVVKCTGPVKEDIEIDEEVEIKDEQYFTNQALKRTIPGDIKDNGKTEVTSKKLSAKAISITAHMQKSELSYQLNPYENRYGNGKAEIVEIGIDSISDKVKYSFFHGEYYRFWFKTLFHDTLESPITAFTIKDVKGFDLTGTNTLFKKTEIGKTKKGDLVLTEFEQRMMLNSGGYLLSFGCAGFEDGEYVVYDRRYDVITFEVISEKPSVGIFDIDSKIKVSRIST